MNKNRIGGLRWRASGPRTAKPISIKLAGGKSGGCGAAMLVDVLVGENPTGGNCPVATVVISGNGTSDQSVESPDVKVSVGWRGASGQLRQGRRANQQVVTKGNCSEAPKSDSQRESEGWGVGSAETFTTCRRSGPSAKELGAGRRRTSRGRRRRHADKEQSMKARNHSLVA
jgi:hypothetical protein